MCCSIVDFLVLSRIDANADPRQNPLFHSVTQQNIFDKGVRGICFLVKYTVVRVQGDFLSVGTIRLNGVDQRDKVLIEEQLSDVRSVDLSRGIRVEQSPVNTDSCGVGIMSEQVDVGGATCKRECQLGYLALKIRPLIPL